MRILLALALCVVPFSAPLIAATCDLIIEDKVLGRNIPARLTLPEGEGRVPLVLWSPGMGGGLEQGAVYAAAWAKAGIATLQLRHPGSDVEAYRRANAAAARETQPAQARAARARVVQEATGPRQILARMGDMAAAQARVAQGGRAGACSLTRVDAGRLGVAGHSMGAWVAQLLVGQRVVGLSVPRLPVRAALVVSGAPLVTPDPPLAASLANVRRPVMVMTGTLDGVRAGAPSEVREGAMAQRTAFWHGLPPEEKYLLVAEGADHMQLAGTRGRMPEALAARLAAVSSDFWRVHLLYDGEAAARLVAPELAPGDRYQRK